MTRRVRGLALGGLVALVVLFASRALLGPARADGDHGPLNPLAPLVGGRWVERDVVGAIECELRWGDEGHSIWERVLVDGEVAAETRYYWHPGELESGSLVMSSVRSDGEVRQGILREDQPGSLEMRFNAHGLDGSGRSYRERIRFLDPDRIVRSLRHVTGEEEILVEERTLTRKR